MGVLTHPTEVQDNGSKLDLGTLLMLRSPWTEAGIRHTCLGFFGGTHQRGVSAALFQTCPHKFSVCVSPIRNRKPPTPPQSDVQHPPMFSGVRRPRDLRREVATFARWRQSDEAKARCNLCQSFFELWRSSMSPASPSKRYNSSRAD